MRKTGLVFLAAALTFSCSLVPSLVAPTPTPTATSTITPSPTPSPTPTATAAPTPLPTIVPPPPPSPGTANVYGRVVWQGLPVGGVRMRLIGPYVSGGRYRLAESSDSDGVFRFLDVSAGEAYELTGLIEESDLNLPAGSVGASEVTFSVVPDSNLDLGSYYLIATDLTLLWPARESSFSDAPPSLSWEPYPGAAYYHVELKQWNGNYADSEIDTPETELELELPLLNCSYGWDVTAYSESGIPLARSDSAFVDDSDDFWQRYDGYITIHNASLPSCGIALISPADYEVIVGGWNVEFIWEPNPLATRYVGSITRTHDAAGNWVFEDYNFGFVVQEDGSLAGAGLPRLPRGQYNWEIFALVEDGRSIGHSGLRYFTIR